VIILQVISKRIVLVIDEESDQNQVTNSQQRLVRLLAKNCIEYLHAMIEGFGIECRHISFCVGITIK